MLGRLLAIAVLCTAILAGPGFAQSAQTAATLIADNIRFSRGTTSVSASGHVEIFYNNTTMRATAVHYEGSTDQIRVEGPITLTEANGRSIVFAEFAELSSDLQNGVLQSARLVLDRQLQIAATQINRIDGRYTQLYQTVASSCEVCAHNPVPLWQIRARRIVHDQLEQQLYFEEAQFRALGIPIAYFPRLRLPDPSLERASGFLTPEIRANDQLGVGIRMPYFFTLGPHTDLTVSPYLTLGGSQTVEARLRRAFRNGFIEANGALSWDDLTTDSTRSYLFAEGWFDLPRDFRLDFGYQTVSDPAYLVTYDFSDEDILNSFATISRASRDEYIELSANRYHSLRQGDNNATLPNHTVGGEITRRFAPAWVGGIATLGLSTETLNRDSTADIIGRDVSRLSAEANWRRDWVLPGGFLGAVEAHWQGDIYDVREDSNFSSELTRSTPFVAAELRWPWARAQANGVTHVIEPIVQYAWAPSTTTTVPNEDSGVVEFDEGNLFALNRFPGADGHELGSRLAFGVSYTREDPLGWSLGLTIGRVLRERDFGQFTPGSGLDSRDSDWLIAARFEMGHGLEVINRALFSETFNVTSNELAVNWANERVDLTSSYTWLQADPAEGRPQDIGEWAFDAAYDFDNAWGAQVDWRYDFEANEPTRAGLAVTYATECVDVEFSLSRRFTTSATLDAATEFGLTVALNGFGATRDGRSYDRTCH